MKTELYFEQKGSGSPIVFIHGSYATTSTWKKMVEHLSLTHHCISIKLPGHGGMPDPIDFDAPTVETELAIIEKVVSDLTDQPIHLVGHSIGGVVALSLALKGSLDIVQMTLYEPVAVWVLDVVNDQDITQQAITIKKMRGRVQDFLTRYRHDFACKDPYVCGQVIDFWCGEGSFEPLPDFIKDSMASLEKNNIRHWDICTAINNSLADLQACSIPTRLVYGTESNPVAHAISNRLYDMLPRSKKYVIEGASHFLVTSHANDCLSVMADPCFLNEMKLP